MKSPCHPSTRSNSQKQNPVTSLVLVTGLSKSDGLSGRSIGQVCQSMGVMMFSFQSDWLFWTSSLLPNVLFDWLGKNKPASSKSKDGESRRARLSSPSALVSVGSSETELPSCVLSLEERLSRFVRVFAGFVKRSPPQTMVIGTLLIIAVPVPPVFCITLPP